MGDACYYIKKTWVKKKKPKKYHYFTYYDVIFYIYVQIYNLVFQFTMFFARVNEKKVINYLHTARAYKI